MSYIRAHFDAVIIEGAGSPAEVNLNAHEIVNMRVAREADVPVVLVTDVDRGGSLASIVGTLELVGSDRERVKGIIFNKFRGDINLFADAVKWTENYTGVKVLGVVPYARDIRIPAEDSLSVNGITTGNFDSSTFDSMAKLLTQSLDINFITELIHHEGTMPPLL